MQRKLFALLVLGLITSSASAETCTQTQYQAPDGSCLPQDVANCKLYTAYTNNCLVCKTGFYAMNGLCSPQNLSNCDVYQANQNLCLTCAIGYYVNGFNVCVAQTAPNCATYVLNKNKCASCVDPLVLVNGACTTTQAQSCSMYAADNVSCLICVTGYYVSNGACLTQSVVNCGAYQPNLNVCISCQSGYYLNQGRCDQAWVARCVSYAPNQNYCLVCLPGYFASNGACSIQNTPNCRSYIANTNQCNYCLSTYYPVDGLCTSQSLPNCQSYVENVNACAACNSGWVLNNGVCVEAVTVPNCSVAQDNLCVTCQAKYYVMDGVCYLQSVPNCQDYAPNENVCKTCFNNYLLTGGVCVGPPSNCQDVYPNTNICQSCVAGYYNLNGACLAQDVAHCQSFIMNTNLCGKCDDGFLLFNGQCNVYTPIQNCLLQVFNGCQTCAPGFYLLNNACILQEINGCAKFVENQNACLECTSGFVLHQDICWLLPLNCLQISTTGAAVACTQCNPSSVLWNGQCYAQTQNCQTYDGVSCVGCASGYNLSNGQCYAQTSIPDCLMANGAVCDLCQIGFYLQNNACLTQNIENCDQYQRNVNSCMACKTGFLLFNGLCQAPQLTCAQFDTTGTVCYVCFAGFYPLNGVCVAQSVPHCADYYFSTNLCYQCASGYSLLNYVCVANSVIPDCLTISGPNCLACNPGFYLVDNGCVKQSQPNCATYVNNSNDCSQCNSGYFVFSGRCFQIPDNCANPTVANNAAVCSGCKGGFFLQSGGCLAQNVANCRTYTSVNSNDCSECLTGFNLSNNVCTAVSNQIPNCKTQQQNTCTACDDKYYLDNNACVAQNVSNCLLHYPNVNLCQTCAPDYTQVAGLCQKNPANCLTIDTIPGGLICSYCKSGFYLSNSSCLTQSISNCATFLNNVNQCSSCANGYALLNNVCYLVPAKCVKIALSGETTICSECVRGFYPDTNGVCAFQDVPNCAIYLVNVNKCQICIPPYQANAAGTCDIIPKIENCSSQQGTVCLYCAAKYYLQDNACLLQQIPHCATFVSNENICLSCDSGFSLFANGCWTNPPNCSGYVFASGVVYCSGCVENFFLENGACKPQTVENCRTFATGSNVCTECQPNYVLFQGFCYLTPANCLTVGFSTNGVVCQTCNSGYQVVNGACMPGVVANCIAFDNKGVCTKCDTKYYLESDGTCKLQNLPHCITFVENTNFCINCEAPYTMIAAECFLPPANCKTYVSVPGGLVCEVCATGYYLTAAKVCEQQAINNCGVFIANQNVCSECKQNFYLDGLVCSPQSLPNCIDYVPNLNLCVNCKAPAVQVAGLCQVPPANCDKYNTIPGGLICETCSSGFYLAQDASCLAGSVSSCATYLTNQNVCQKCLDGFYLNNNVCIKQTGGNCLTFFPDSNLCQVCVSPFVANAGICLMPPDNCDNYTTIPGGFTCQTCKSGFYALQGVCLAQDQPGCQTFLSNVNLCSVCQKGYLPIAGVCSPVPKNCDTASVIDNVVVCQTCLATFYLNNNSCQTQSLTGCKTYVDNFNLCLVCLPDYTLVAGLCQLPPANCDKFVTIPGGLVCETCSTGYYLDNTSVCKTQSIENCGTFVSNQNVCATCSTGFYLNNNACPAQNVANCFKHVSNFNLCQECKAEFALVAGLCQPWPLNCSKYLTITGGVICEICKTGYYVADGVCVPQFVENCASYTDNTNTCVKCNTNYLLQNNVCVYQLPIDKCADQVGGICNSCVSGYYLANNFCLAQDITGCKTYVQNLNLCVACNSGYILSAGLCVVWPANCNAYGTNLGGVFCKTCNATYYPLNGVCTSQNILNCDTYVSNENTCQSCKPGFLLQANACVTPTPIENCATQTLQTCTVCKVGFYLNSNACLTQAVPNCKDHVPNLNQCANCDANFALGGGQCFLVPITCQKYTVSAAGLNCEICNSGFYSNNGNCLAQSVQYCAGYTFNTNTCTSCDPNFTLQGNTCVSTSGNAIPHCSNQDGATCYDCDPGYYLSNNACPAQTVTHCSLYENQSNNCLFCDTGYELSNNVCLPIPSNCQSYNITPTKVVCTDCFLKFYIQDGNCVPQEIKDCDVPVLNENKCQACYPNFYLANGNTACLPQDLQNCSIFVEQQNVCLICIQNYDLLNGACYKIPDNCISYQPTSNMLSCTECKSGFYPSAGICEAQSVGFCKDFQANTNICLACHPGYQLLNGGTLCQGAVDPNCNVKNTDGTCKTCKANFYPSSGLCTAQSIPGCGTYVENQNVCVSCQSGFNMNSAGFCEMPSDPNCLITLLDSNACDLCIYGYYVSDGRCLSQSVKECADYTINTNTCLTCNTNFYLTNQNTCLAQDVPGCLLYNSNVNTCNICDFSMTNYNGICISGNPVDPNCGDLVGDVCAACKSGFYLLNSKCFTQNILNCQTYVDNENICKTCASGYTLSLGRCFGSGQTPVTIENCLRQTGSVCSFCNIGYFWDAAQSTCAATVEEGVAFKYTEGTTTKFITLVYTPDFTGFMFTGSTTVQSIFNNAIISSLVPPEGKYHFLKFNPDMYLSEGALNKVEIFYNPMNTDKMAQWELIPGTAANTYTIKNAQSNKYLQGCCLTGLNPVIFTVVSVDGVSPA